MDKERIKEFQKKEFPDRTRRCIRCEIHFIQDRPYQRYCDNCEYLIKIEVDAAWEAGAKSEDKDK